MNINLVISELVEYATRCELIEKDDRAYAVARLMELLHVSDYTPCRIIPRVT